MEQRTLGRTGLKVSVLGFGCGAVGGLMVKGSAADQERAIGRALDLGINYFDTAPMYGNGESEKNLGRALKNLRHADVLVGTKVFIPQADRGHIAEAITRALDESLRRLGLEQIDIYQLHNFISEGGSEDTIAAHVALAEAAPALARLRQQGKARNIGFTSVGETPALQRVLDAAVFETAQLSYNLLNPSAGGPVASGYPAQDFGDILGRAQKTSTGVIGIRVLAGGALSAVETRHALGMPKVDPIGTSATYAADVARAKRLQPLVDAGHADSLIEAGLRFAISHPAMSTILVGYSSLEQLEFAAKSVNKGPLSRAALDQVAAIQSSFVGEAR